MSNLPEDNPDVVAAVSTGPGAPSAHAEPVLVFRAASNEEAEVVRATLEAAGIPATLQLPNVSAGTGLLTETVGGDTWSEGIYVSPSNVEAALAILNTPPPSEAELTAEEEADPTRLEDAEAQIKNA